MRFKYEPNKRNPYKINSRIWPQLTEFDLILVKVYLKQIEWNFMVYRFFQINFFGSLFCKCQKDATFAAITDREKEQNQNHWIRVQPNIKILKLRNFYGVKYHVFYMTWLYLTGASTPLLVKFSSTSDGLNAIGNHIFMSKSGLKFWFWPDHNGDDPR